MNIVGICGSPRRNGNSELILNEVLKGARRLGAQTKKIILNDLLFKPCQACGGCDATGYCVIHDDMEVVYAALRRADVVVVSSPIYFGNISAQTKMMIDRFQCEWVRRFILGKNGNGKVKGGVFLCVLGENDERQSRYARTAIRIFFNCVGAKYCAELISYGLSKKGSIKKMPGVMKKAFDLGKSIAGGKIEFA